MTGPDHFRQAEDILAHAKGADEDADLEQVGMLLRFAEMHIRLAQAAATIDAAYGQLAEPVGEDWAAAFAGRPTPSRRRGPSFGEDAA